jgi:hypothetical protein
VRLLDVLLVSLPSSPRAKPFSIPNRPYPQVTVADFHHNKETNPIKPVLAISWQYRAHISGNALALVLYMQQDICVKAGSYSPHEKLQQFPVLAQIVDGDSNEQEAAD